MLDAVVVRAQATAAIPDTGAGPAIPASAAAILVDQLWAAFGAASTEASGEM